MARTEARIHTSIWRDSDWRSLSVHAQWLYELLLSQPTVSFCGVLGLMPTRWAKMAKGMTLDDVLAHLGELEEARYVVIDHDTEEVWIRSFVKWDGVLEQPALITAMMKDFAAIQSEPIRDGFLDGLGDGFLDGLPERFPKWFGGGKERVIPDEFLEGSRVRDARAGASARIPPPPPLTPTPSSSPAPTPAACEPKTEPMTNGHARVEEEEEIQETAKDAAMVVAMRRLLVRDGPPITDTNAWLNTTAKRIYDEHGAALRAGACSGESPEDMADRIQPGPPKPLNPYAPVPNGEFVEVLDEEGRLVEAKWVAAS